MASVRIALRFFLGACVLACALVLFGSRADAAESDPPPEAAAEPPPDATPPPAEAQETLQDAPPAGADPPPEEPSAEATPADDHISSEEQATNDQNADVETGGTAVANTGQNTADASTVDHDGPPGPPATNENDADATVGSGPSAAVGGETTTTISQQAAGTAVQNGAVDIVQVTLVVNLGHAGANTGANLAAGVAGPGSGSIGSAGAQASSGDATATGNHTNTSLTQSAIVLSGETSMQIATVLNIGIGVGNSGMNLAVANVIMNAAASAALGGNSSAASVATGGANATGNRTTTTIAQTAAGVATGNSTLSIKQRALVLNLGIAFANSGANVALSGLGVDEQAELLTQIVAFLDPLFEQFGLYTDDFVGGVGGGAVAGVQTGTASAVGNDATTTISQNIVGTSRGDATTQASQLAVVANFGLALSNTGLNAALAQIGDGQSMAPARGTATDSELARFFSLLHDLDWLTSGNPFASFAETIELDGLTLNFGGDISGVEYLVGWDEDAFPDGGPIPGGVRVRQITAVIDISYAWSNSGRNVAVALVTGSNMVRHVGDRRGVRRAPNERRGTAHGRGRDGCRDRECGKR